MSELVIPALEETMAIFFEYQLTASWLTDAKPIENPDLPGAHIFPWVKGPWQVVDIYWTTKHSQNSFGYLVISYEGQPVWRQEYSGFYEKDAIPFLKEALRMAYDDHLFLGGRGVLEFVKNDLHYRNCPQSHQDFRNFDGIEGVYNEAGNLKGFHQYNGGRLVELR